MATNIVFFAPDISLERALTESYLIQQSHFAPEQPISSFPQSLKEHGSGSLQLRMRLVTESRARSAQADVGGFDVRRTDWATLRNMEDPTRAGSAVWLRQDEDWEPQTLYVVSCKPPPPHPGVSLNLIRNPTLLLYLFRRACHPLSRLSRKFFTISIPFVVVWIMALIGMKGRQHDRLASSTMCTYRRVMAHRTMRSHSSKALLLSFSQQESMRRRLLKNGHGWSRESKIHCRVKTRTLSQMRIGAAFVPCPCKECFSIIFQMGM